MCGIAGIYGAGTSVSSQQLSSALALLAKRGPDHQQCQTSQLGQLMAARLSIVDITGPTDAILTSPDGRYRIAYNGEVLNHQQLAAELRTEPWRAQTRRDTEVVLRLVARHGLSAAARLQGQFAYIVEDTRERRVLAARDAYGICPLWFARHGDTGLLLASSPACLLRLGAAPSQITALPQCHTLVWEADSGRLSIAAFQPATNAHEHVADEPLPQSIYRSVRSRVPHEVPYATIAGGLDSSLVTAICASHSHQPSCTITVATDLPEDVSTDVRNARWLERLYGVPSVVARIAEDFILEHIADVIDDVCSASHIVVTAALMSRKAGLIARSAGAKVLVTGGGADELFGGYAFVWRRFPRACIEDNLEHIRRQTGLFDCHREDASISPTGVEPRPAYYAPELERRLAEVPLDQRLPGIEQVSAQPVGPVGPVDKALLRAAAKQFPKFPSEIAATPKKALYESTAIDRLVARTARRQLSEQAAQRWYERHFARTSWAYLVPRNELHAALWIHKVFCERFPALADLTPRTTPPTYQDAFDYGRYHPALGMPILQRSSTTAVGKQRRTPAVHTLPVRSGRSLMSF